MHTTLDDIVGTLSGRGAMEQQAPTGRDLISIAQYLIPTQAQLVCGCLVAAGVPAVVADYNHAQAAMWLTPAMGGVRILVPLSFEHQARQALEAYERGEFCLPDDADVGALRG
ncbi:MAG: hypothetical protein V4754_14135 [Pseudomonadota bacterium]